MDPFLQAALDEARQGLREGGIPIGSVLVSAGRILGRGHNRRQQSGSVVLHGEMDALENTGRQPASVYRQCTIYTTLSPCAMCTRGHSALRDSAGRDRREPDVHGGGGPVAEPGRQRGGARRSGVRAASGGLHPRPSRPLGRGYRALSRAVRLTAWPAPRTSPAGDRGRTATCCAPRGSGRGRGPRSPARRGRAWPRRAICPRGSQK